MAKERNVDIQQRIEDTLQQMEADVFAPTLASLALVITPFPLKEYL